MSAALPPLVIGVDVGTGSARAGIFTLAGQMLSSAKSEIALWRDSGDLAEQSSADIWRAVCSAVRAALTEAKVEPARIAGLGFDATCSLVVLGPGGQPLPVGTSGDPARDIIVWMDQRARGQAERINAQGHRVLDYVGGRISPEMQTPKLLWLKENLPDTYRRAWQFLDLTDFLSWRATGDLARSTCTVTCKWTYMAQEAAWDGSYFRAIGLDELADEGFERIGARVVPAGCALGQGLSEAAAAELGLSPGTPVGAGLIDAHAGGIGSVGAAGGAGGGPTRSMAYVFGTSSCTMTSTENPVFVPGVWGPYFSAMVPGLWLNEGGQSAAGAAIEALLALHPHAAQAESEAQAAGRSLADWLLEKARGQDPLSLAAGVHVVPEFLGNRAPFADPATRAAILGLGLDRDLQSLLGLYLAGLCGIGYGLRQILEAQSRAGAAVDSVVISGGAGRHPLIRQLLADACGLVVTAPEAEEPILLGSAILGAVAAGLHADIPQAMAAMSRIAETYPPQDAARARHQRRFEIFERLQALAREAARER